MTIKIGSARHDENGTYTGGEAGDQTGSEVSTQTMYTHSKGWYVLRLKSATNATKPASKMQAACDNSHIGYDQDNRLAIIDDGISTTKDTECDCSSLVRECIIEVTGTDPGNFTTANEKSKLEATGLFEDAFAYTSQSATPVYNGDVLVTKSKGHTAIVVSGNTRSSSSSSSSSTSSSSSSSSLTVDGAWGKKTTKAMQTALGTTVDGVVSNQLSSCKKYLEAADTGSWKFSSSKSGGSEMVKALQKKVSADKDGYAGKATVKALQKWLNSKCSSGLDVDGYMGTKTVKAVQKALNNNKF